MTYLRGRTWWGRARPGPWRPKVRVSLGTGDKKTGVAIQRVLLRLEDERRWHLLEAVCSRSMTAGEVYDAAREGRLADLERRLTDFDVATLVPDWVRWLEARVEPSTAAKYARQLEILVGPGESLLVSEIDRAFVARKLQDLLAAGRSGSTARRYLAAWSRFFTFLRDRGLLDRNPARDVSAPRPNRARESWIPIETSLRLLEAADPRYRALFALLEGAGVEIGAALRTRRRDVDLERRIVHVHGTKTRARDRFAKVDEAFWPEIEAHCRLMTPATGLWEGVTADMARHFHRKACAAIGLSDYRMHDARHSFAVRKMKLGVEPHLIARNLGHADATMVLKVYGKYRPALDDLDRLDGSGIR